MISREICYRHLMELQECGNNIMSELIADCFVHDRDYFSSVSLSYTTNIDQSDIDTLNIVLDALDELAPIVKPLTLEFYISCRHRECGFIEHNLNPSNSACLIREESIPEYVGETRMSSSNQKLICKLFSNSVINRNKIIGFIESSLNQNCPNTDIYQASWSNLWILNTQAWIGNEDKFINAKVLKLAELGGDTTVDIPIKKQDNGVWVAGSVASELFPEPISIYISNDFALELDIRINWSLWAESKYTAYQGLVNALKRIIAKGWKPSVLGEGFKIIGNF